MRNEHCCWKQIIHGRYVVLVSTAHSDGARTILLSTCQSLLLETDHPWQICGAGINRSQCWCTNNLTVNLSVIVVGNRSSMADMWCWYQPLTVMVHEQSYCQLVSHCCWKQIIHGRYVVLVSTAHSDGARTILLSTCRSLLLETDHPWQICGAGINRSQ